MEVWAVLPLRCSCRKLLKNISICYCTIKYITAYIIWLIMNNNYIKTLAIYSKPQLIQHCYNL